MEKYTFNAKYYDGKSSIGYQAEVEFLDDCIKISYYNSSFQWTFVKWAIANVKSAEHLSKTSSTIQYGKFPFEYIETQNPNCIDEYRKRYLKDSFFTKLYHQAVRGNKQLVTIACAAVIIIAATGYFYLLPKMADYFAQYLMAKEWEISMGNNFFKTITKEMEIDSAKTELANKFLIQTDFETTYPVKITVVKSGIINAFAMPGGNIVIFDTLLYMLESPQELAALIGHELTHVEKRHSTRMLCRNLAGYMFISLISGDVNGISAVLVENAHAVAGLKYVRSLEEEADKNSIALLRKSNLNPNGMVDLLQHLKKVEEDKKREWYSWFLSHPLTDDRIAYSKAEIKSIKSAHTEDKELTKLYQDLMKIESYNCEE
jgi:beta-barrel assembly-enhancing protease